jgi:hypothetical protein
VIRWREAIAACILSTACAARIPPRPNGTATPDPSAIEAFTQATAICAGAKTLTGSLRLSGRAGADRIRGTLLAGLAAPASLRFEAVAPFGQPFFILGGRDNRATLFFPREHRVLADTAVSDILQRLLGLALSATDIRLILTGCLASPATPSNGRSWPSGWRAVALAAAASGGPPITAYLKTINGRPEVVAADHGAWRVDYANHQNGFPRSVRIRDAVDNGVDITAIIEQLEINTGIDETVFVVTVAPGAAPMSLEELKSVTPLREGRQ